MSNPIDSETGYLDDDKQREYEQSAEDIPVGETGNQEPVGPDAPRIVPILSRVNIVTMEDEMERRRR